ncbi:MAG: PRC-barrel domain-containing protein [Methanobrevibacter sp.]|jgi:sporulation protein YlmC with PRC-barrel domain|nr:PRC-barrel domain-containing protein [Candidatus Methanovirga aequatorialis]
MKVNQDVFGKEVLNTDGVIVGKVHDMEFDDETREIKSIIVKKGGLTNTLNISKGEYVIPFDMIKAIGDKILLKDAFEDDILI